MSAFDDIHNADLPGMFDALGAADGTYIDGTAETPCSVLLELGVTEYPYTSASQSDPMRPQAGIAQSFDRASLLCNEVQEPRTRATINIGNDIYRIDRIVSRDGFVTEMTVLKVS